MDMSRLDALSPLDGRYAEHLAPLRQIFSEYGLMRYRLSVEVHWLGALTEGTDLIPACEDYPRARARLMQLVEDFSSEDATRIKQIESQTRHDVKAIEYFLREKLEQDALTQHWVPWIHFACTSEDINNLSYGLMMQASRQDVVAPALGQLIEQLANLSEQHADVAMLSRTHGQPASPTTLGKELANFTYRLERQRRGYQAIEIMGKMNGAVGNFNAHHASCPEVDWPTLTQRFVAHLGLVCNPYTTQIEPHDNLAELLQALSRINTVLIDLTQDIWGYISLGYFRQHALAGEVGSSTMPHKINPIDFENAEGNLGMANAIFDHLCRKLPISRWQRDLSDSTVLRNLGVGVAHSYLAYQSILRGLGKLSLDETALAADLASHWELLAEPIQTVMRRHGIPDAYEQLKAFSRGRAIDAELLHSFVRALELPEQVRETLLAMRPQDYIGRAAIQARALKQYLDD